MFLPGDGIPENGAARVGVVDNSVIIYLTNSGFMH
jgi:hypothetical protein